ncbi:MAG: hypothetical protein P0Y65_02610 [Candidatus Devosia phytovorans]|uniref:Adenylate cyclase n=1 Tax=Candidatus Devosia phytovorans TaxID=3121372 RepID=A0AAJ6B0W7_9HYPH|nr:hypothetical protein [Devosia sp.]WEK05166.1 MAG: hypothetical protein P0Y65_02610 [Devosia sp.]
MWPEIARSPQLGKFLDYIVQRTLVGDEQAIKAYSIAVDVFGRGEDFDPQSDPIVRVQARRLRSLIDDYYRGPGANDALQIRLPTGRYIPEFVAGSESAPAVPDADAGPGPTGMRPGAPVQSKSTPRYLLGGIVGAIVLGVVALVLFVPRQRGDDAGAGLMDRPVIGIVEFQNLVIDTARPPQVAGLAIELVTDLEQFENLRVLYRSGAEADVGTNGAPLDDFVLTGIVRQDGDQVQYSAILTDTHSGAVVWDQTLTVPQAEAAQQSVLDRVSLSFGLVLGSPRGPLHAAARQLMATASPVDNVTLYLCRVLFDRYRETGSSTDAQGARACFDALPEVDKQDAIALAAQASLMAEGGDGSAETAVPQADRVRQAQINLNRALADDPISGFIWEQQARLHAGQGNLPLARADYASSVQLNAANADALAGFALILALSGGLDQAELMARNAAEHSPQPPPWYFAVPTLLSLRDGNYAAAVESAELYAQADRELGPVLAIMAAQQAGNGDVVNRYLPEVLEVASFRAKGVLPRLRERISDDGLIDSIRGSLTEAGVPWAALTRGF